MKIDKIQFSDNPLKEMIAAWNEHGDNSVRFSMQDLVSDAPGVDAPDKPQATHTKLARFTKRIPFVITGSFVYPPGGGMGWHTNSNLAGTRTYLSWSETGDSGMGWIADDGTVRWDYDAPGWNVRVFHVPKWHCVFANCWRCSVGINSDTRAIQDESVNA